MYPALHPTWVGRKRRFCENVSAEQPVPPLVQPQLFSPARPSRQRLTAYNRHPSWAMLWLIWKTKITLLILTKSRA
jgi:hypothetical protein